MQTTFYPAQIMSHLLNPLNTGRMEVDNKTIFMADIGDIAKSIKIDLYFKIDNGIITEISYLVYGNGYIIAALSHLSVELKGVRFTQAMNYSMHNLANKLEIPVNIIPNLKLIKQAIDDIIKQYLVVNPVFK